MIVLVRSSGATLPNLIVYIDIRDGEPTTPSLFALSDEALAALLSILRERADFDAARSTAATVLMTCCSMSPADGVHCHCMMR